MVYTTWTIEPVELFLFPELTTTPFAGYRKQLIESGSTQLFH